jgi:G3E family GTPase
MTTPVLLVTGFLGSGKTTLLRRLATEGSRRRLFLVNEFSPIDVDGELMRVAGASPVMDIVGGSIFCRCKVTEFVEVLRRARGVIAEQAIEELVIEASGMADPRAMETLLRETGLANDYRLVRVVTVVDPGRFLKLVGMVPVVEAQIQAADVVLLNKVDLYSEALMAEAEAVLRRSAPTVPVVRVTRCAVSLDDLPDRHRPSPGEEHGATARDPLFATLEIPMEEVGGYERLREALEAVRPYLYRVKGVVRRADGSREIWEETGHGLERSPAPSDVAPTPLVVVCRRGKEEWVLRRLVRASSA